MAFPSTSYRVSSTLSNALSKRSRQPCSQQGRPPCARTLFNQGSTSFAGPERSDWITHAAQKQHQTRVMTPQTAGVGSSSTGGVGSRTDHVHQKRASSIASPLPADSLSSRLPPSWRKHLELNTHAAASTSASPPALDPLPDAATKTPSSSTRGNGSPGGAPLQLSDTPSRWPRNLATTRRSSPLAYQHFYDTYVLDKYVQRPIRRITLRQLLAFGRNLTVPRLLQSANYVLAENTTRLAHRLSEFQSLPYYIGIQPKFVQVYQAYWHAFEIMSSIKEIKTLEDNRKFCETLEVLLKQHLTVIPALCLAVMESPLSSPEDFAITERFMKNMLQARIGRRVLGQQHIKLTAELEAGAACVDRSVIGMVDRACLARDVVHTASLVAIEMMKNTFPHIAGELPLMTPIDGDVNATLTCVRGHMEFVLLELLKNAYKAVYDTHGTIREDDVIVTICQGPEDLVLRVSDKGGGIKEDIIPFLCDFSFRARAPFRAHLKARLPTFMAATMSEQVSSHDRHFDDVHTISPKVLDTHRHAKMLSRSSAPLGSSEIGLAGTLPPSPSPPPATTATTAGVGSSGGTRPIPSPPPLSSSPTSSSPPSDAGPKLENIGFGAALAKVYIDYWGGEMVAESLLGYGTDVYVRVNPTGHQVENISKEL